MANLATILISFLALIVSYAALNASRVGAKAAIYDQRFAVYRDAEEFLSIWLKNGRPDLTDLPLLVSAWSRSQFLFEDDVTAYLRKIWTDATRAHLLQHAIDDVNSPDRGAAIEEQYQITIYHSDFERLRKVFMPTLRLETSRILSPFSLGTRTRVGITS